MLIAALARTPGTLLHQDLTGDGWTLDQHLLAIIADRVGLGNWQRQGKKGAKRPPPLSPLAKRTSSQRVGRSKGRDPDTVKALLHGYRTGAFERG